MLEIASEIIVCLLIAATIGAAIGYLVCKSLSEKAIEVSADPLPEETPVEENIETEKKEAVIETAEVSKETTQEKEIEIPTEAVIETAEVSKEMTQEEEVEIPTEDAIEKALEALEEIDEQENEDTPEQVLISEKPELLSEARNGEKDKLSEIKGVGPKLEEKLNEAGIYHFDQIANWSEENIKWLEENTVFAHRAKKDLWVRQAKMLA